MRFTELQLSNGKEIKLWDKIPDAISDEVYTEEPRIDEQGNITGVRKVGKTGQIDHPFPV